MPTPASHERLAEALDAVTAAIRELPRDSPEWVARLAALKARADAVLDTASFTVDLAAKKVHRDGVEVHLTPTEWGVLEVLVRNRGRLVTQKQLLQEVWGPAYSTESHYLRVYMAQLRRKLEADPARPRHLVTEAGMGYRFQP